MSESPFGPRKVRSAKAPADANGDVPPPPPPPPNAPTSPQTAAPAKTWGKRAAGAAPAKPAGSVAQPTGKRPAALSATDKARFVTVIQKFARARESAATVRPRQVLASTLVIQEEFRDYLARTRFTRGAMRARRKDAQRRLHMILEGVIQATRDGGRRIIAEEADGRRRLGVYNARRQTEALTAEEERIRAATFGSEAREFGQMVSSSCPPDLMPGTMENDEHRERNHVVKLWYAEWCVLMQRHVAMCAYQQRLWQAQRRERILAQEAGERLGVIDDFGVALRSARLDEAVGNEERLRDIYGGQRDDYVTALRVQLALTTRTIIAVAARVPEAEPYQRATVERAADEDLADLFLDHLAQRMRLSGRELEADEGVGRRHIRRHELESKCRIAAAVVAVQLQLLQQDRLEDVTCEYGARTAIRWHEQRARHNLLSSMHAGSAGLVVPGEESGARLRLLRQEREGRADVMRTAPLRSFIIAVEVSRRRAIFGEWVGFTHKALFKFAELSLQASELRRRRYLLRLFELEAAHVASMEYLHLAEADDRRTLLRGLQRLGAGPPRLGAPPSSPSPLRLGTQPSERAKIPASLPRRAFHQDTQELAMVAAAGSQYHHHQQQLQPLPQRAAGYMHEWSPEHPGSHPTPSRGLSMSPAGGATTPRLR